jgi:hypothetical protein
VHGEREDAVGASIGIEEDLGAAGDGSSDEEGLGVVAVGSGKYRGEEVIC